MLVLAHDERLAFPDPRSIGWYVRTCRQLSWIELHGILRQHTAVSALGCQQFVDAMRASLQRGIMTAEIGTTETVSPSDTLIMLLNDGWHKCKSFNDYEDALRNCVIYSVTVSVIADIVACNAFLPEVPEFRKNHRLYIVDQRPPIVDRSYLVGAFSPTSEDLQTATYCVSNDYLAQLIALKRHKQIVMSRDSRKDCVKLYCDGHYLYDYNLLYIDPSTIPDPYVDPKLASDHVLQGTLIESYGG